jgi:hypothetical protein
MRGQLQNPRIDHADPESVPAGLQQMIDASLSRSASIDESMLGHGSTSKIPARPIH